MASLWKDERTPHFVACITGMVGGRRARWKRTTGTDDRKLARRIMDELEDAAQGRRSAEEIKVFLEGIDDLKTRRIATRSFDEVLKLSTGSGLESRTVRDFVTGWLARTKGEVAQGTQSRYEQTAKLFLESLEGLAGQDMRAVREEHVARFRDQQAQRVSPSTANLYLKIVRIVCMAAESAGILSRSPAKGVKLLKVAKGSARRAFTVPELRTLLAVVDDEWRGLILFGYYTAMRLGDLAALRWQQIDLMARTVTYSSRKTGGTASVPLVPALMAYLEKQPMGDDPRQPVFPRAHETLNNEGRSSTLSRQFSEWLALAGLVAERSHAKAKGGLGRASRRAVSEVSFHSLRHSCVTHLKAAGVSGAIAQDIAGHESAEISRLYTHLDDDVKREAMAKLPDLSAPIPTGGDDVKEGRR